MATKKIVKKKKKTNVYVRLAMLCAMVVVSIVLMNSSFKEVKTTFTLHADISDYKQQLQDLKNESQKLVNEQEKLQDENYVKNYARGELMITKEGEQVFHLPNTNETGE